MSSSSLVLFIALLSVLCTVNFASPTLRILGGDEVKNDDFPYIVSVRRNTAHVCGGSIIAINYILTAAHCVSKVGTTPVDASDITVRVGSTNQYAGGSIVHVEKIIMHGSYGSFLNDVAILKLSADLVLSSKIQIISMAEESNFVVPGDSVVIAGWGSTEVGGTKAYKLHQGKAEVISAEDCNNSTGYGHGSILCVQNKLGSGACNGDAGGPAVLNKKLVGVGNFVIGTCGTKYPDMYARVSHFYKWVDSVINPQ